MEQRIEKIEEEMRTIHERNQRVEADKAWETSRFRIFSICVITYVVAAVVMYLIGVKNIFLNALIPTCGYYLSTRSLSLVKQWWIRKYVSR